MIVWVVSFKTLLFIGFENVFKVRSFMAKSSSIYKFEGIYYFDTD